MMHPGSRVSLPTLLVTPDLQVRTIIQRVIHLKRLSHAWGWWIPQPNSLYWNFWGHSFLNIKNILSGTYIVGLALGLWSRCELCTIFAKIHNAKVYFKLRKLKIKHLKFTSQIGSEDVTVKVLLNFFGVENKLAKLHLEAKQLIISLKITTNQEGEGNLL